MLPADAAAKAEEKAKTIDYYADLTDEERAEEGLPPRESSKELAPGEKPPGTEPAAPPQADDEPESDDITESLFDEIAGLREDLGVALAQAPAPAPAEKKPEDPLLAAALDHDDPVIRGLAERLQQAETRLAERETEARESRTDRQLAQDDFEFETVQASYLIGGKPMTDAHCVKIEDYILDNPEVGRRLSIEQITRVVYPDAVRVTAKSPPAKGPGDAANGAGEPVATIVDRGGSTVATPGGFKPRPNESIQSAIDAYAASQGIKR